MKKMNTLGWVALVLIIVGAINWGLVGLFGFNLVELIFGGPDSLLTKLVYALVGLAGVYELVLLAMPDRA